MATIKKAMKLKPVNAVNIKSAATITSLLNQAKNLLIKRLIEQETKKYMSKTAKERSGIAKEILQTKKQIKKIN
jgi:hypothetical protein